MGNRARAIQPVAGAAVPSAKLIRQMVDPVRGFDGALHYRRDVIGRYDVTVYNDGRAASINTFRGFGGKGTAREGTESGEGKQAKEAGHERPI